MEPPANVMVLPDSVKSPGAFWRIPLRNSCKLAPGLGLPVKVNEPFDPSTAPAGISVSTNTGPVPPLAAAHAPEDPSTLTQSERLPSTDSIAPSALIIATRE